MGLVGDDAIRHWHRAGGCVIICVRSILIVRVNAVRFDNRRVICQIARDVVHLPPADADSLRTVKEWHCGFRDDDTFRAWGLSRERETDNFLCI